MGDLQASVARLNESQERLFAKSRYVRDQARRRLFQVVSPAAYSGRWARCSST